MNKDGTIKFKIPAPLEKRLQEESNRTGFSFSEILRRSVDEYLEKKEEISQQTRTKDQ